MKIFCSFARNHSIRSSQTRPSSGKTVSENREKRGMDSSSWLKKRSARPLRKQNYHEKERTKEEVPSAILVSLYRLVSRRCVNWHRRVFPMGIWNSIRARQSYCMGDLASDWLLHVGLTYSANQGKPLARPHALLANDRCLFACRCSWWLCS